MIKAVLFDLDGTLVNTLEDIADSVNYVLEKSGFNPRPVENFKQYVGNGIAKMIVRALPDGYKNEKTLEKLKKDFLVYYKERCAIKSKPYDEILNLLENLKRNGIKICVVSNKEHSMCISVIEKVFGEEYFDVVVGQRDDVPQKPQPHMAYIAMNEIDVNADECLFVGDSYTDMLTGGSAGNVTVGVLWGFRDEKELKEAGARFIFKKPNEIFELINKINGI